MKYIPITNAVMRYPVYPVMQAFNALENPDEFDRIIHTEQFRQALYFASPTLYDEFIKYLDERMNDRDRQRMRNSIVKYLCRMSTRCTPFAMFAACAVARIGHNPNLTIPEHSTARFRYDMLSLCTLSQFLQQDPRIMIQSRFRANTSIYILGRRIRYVSYRYTLSGRSYRLSEMTKTRILSATIKLTRHFTSFRQIADTLSQSFGLNQTEAEKYVRDLVNHQILVSELDPTIIGEDYLDRLVRLTGAGNSALLPLQTLLDDLNQTGKFDDKLPIIAKIADEFHRMGVKCDRKYELQIDLTAPGITMELSDKIIGQLTKALEFLNKVMPEYSNHALNDFKARMEQRYEGEEIPLLEALDTEAGIGYAPSKSPASLPLIGQIKPPGRHAKTLRNFTLTPLNKVLMEKLLSSDCPHPRCITLSDSDFAGTQAPSLSRLPLTMAAMFRIIGKSDDKYLIDSLFFSGSSGANLLGRFAYCSDEIHDIVRTITANEQAAYPEELVAEIAHISESRTGNILARPQIRDYEIEYLTNSTMGDSHAIPVSDLMVSIRNGRIKIRSKALDRYIIPRLTTAHNYSNNTTPVYRFLCDMQSYGLRPSLKLSWDTTGIEMERYPRVMYEQIILSRAMWKCRKSEFTDKKGHLDTTKFNQWRSRLELPRYVQLTVGDNILPIDLDNPMSIDAFVSELTHNGNFILEEFIFPENATCNNAGQAYLNECIIPFVRVK